jgi:BirA family biotin operon repressor/biotin-[acetyl-CoA-carboxylase] ligase
MIHIISNQEINVKWPNDIYLNKSKVAGILVETITRQGNISHAVIGIGINLSMPAIDEKIVNV